MGTNDKQVSKNKVNKLNNFLESDNLDITTLFQIEQVRTKNENIITKAQIENEIIQNQLLDSGSAISAISLLYYKNNFKYSPIVKANLNFRSYSGENITPVGLINVIVKFNHNNHNLKLYIVENGSPPLLRNDQKKFLGIKINIDFEMNNITCQNYSNRVSLKFGTYNKNKCKLFLRDDFKPIFFQTKTFII